MVGTINSAKPSFTGKRLDRAFEWVAEKCPNNVLPSIPKNIASFGAEMRPSQNRLGIGIFALFSQTLIDFFNPFVDKDTAKNSGYRTAAKMIVTTASGIFAREVGQRLSEYLVMKYKLEPSAGIKKIAEKISTGQVESEIIFFGKKIQEAVKKAVGLDAKRIIIAKARYCQAIGNVAGVIAAILSIFCADMLFIDPLTNFALKTINKVNPLKTEKKKG